ncbi:MAG: molybdenum cofactor biosynthesis protein MoaE [Verrucomicrobiota bacterium]
MFSLSADPLEGRDFAKDLVNPESGACVIFVGRVRVRHGDRKVKLLEYEASEKQAGDEFAKIVEESRKEFNTFDIRGVHRTGSVRVGEMAVWIGVTAAHRNAAFAACQYVIDELKKRLPIWKKEHYEDGTSAWLTAGE